MNDNKYNKMMDRMNSRVDEIEKRKIDKQVMEEVNMIKQQMQDQIDEEIKEGIDQNANRIERQ